LDLMIKKRKANGNGLTLRSSTHGDLGVVVSPTT
jgi:hypothetical protein